jgi:hypothetical protein
MDNGVIGAGSTLAAAESGRVQMKLLKSTNNNVVISRTMNTGFIVIERKMVVITTPIL